MSPITYAPAAADPVDYAFHAAAGIFDLLEGAAFDELAADIKAHGLKLPIVLHDGLILDGRNRYRACKAAGVDPMFRQWDGAGSPSEFVWSLNNHRRHLDGNARALAAGRYAIAQEAEAKTRQVSSLKRGEKSPLASNDAHGKSGRSRTSAAKKFGVSEGTVDRAAKVVKKGTPELQKAVTDDKVSVSAAAEIAALPPEKQQEIVASADPVAALKVEQTKLQAFRDSLPKPSEAKQKAKEVGGVVLATDGRLHSGSTPEQKRVHDAFMTIFDALLTFTDDALPVGDVLAGCPDDATRDDFLARCQDAAGYLNTLNNTFQKAAQNG